MRGRRIFRESVDPYLAPAWQDPPEPPEGEMHEPSDFELRIRNEITVEEYVHRLKAKTRQLAANNRRHVRNKRVTHKFLEDSRTALRAATALLSECRDFIDHRPHHTEPYQPDAACCRLEARVDAFLASVDPVSEKEN